MSGRKESVAQRSFFHLSSMRNLFSYVDTAKVRWNGPKKPDGPTAKNLSEKASAQGLNRGGCQCAGTARPAGTSPPSAQASGIPCAGTARPAGTSPTSVQSSGMPLSKGAKGRSKKCLTAANYKALRKNYKALRKNYKALRKNYKALRKNYKALRKNYKALRKNYKALRKNYKALRKNYKALRKRGCVVINVYGAASFF